MICLKILHGKALQICKDCIAHKNSLKGLEIYDQMQTIRWSCHQVTFDRLYTNYTTLADKLNLEA